MWYKRIVPFCIGLALLAAPALSCGDRSTTGPGDDPGNGDGSEPEPYSVRQRTGASAHDFLATDSFSTVLVEVDYMAGHEPDAGALSQLESFLGARLNKSTITVLTPSEIPAGGQDTYSLDDAVDLEDAHRDRLPSGDTITAYMLVVDGKFQQDNVLGVAYYNTSTVYFGAAHEEASGGIGQVSREQLQATIFRHEFGHLFGLVAIPGSGTDMQTEHQDGANGNHCDNDRCLMYYAIESTDLFGSVFGSSVPELDTNCLADLAANGGR